MSKRFRRVLALMLSGAMVFSTAACSKSDSSSDGAGSKPDTKEEGGSNDSLADSDEVVTIVYAGGTDSTGATAEIIEAFEESHPNIKIQRVDMPADQGAQHDAYVTSFAAGGTDYDVIDSNVTWPAEFAEAGYILPIDTLIERDGFDLSSFVPGYVDAYTFKGQIWGIPCHTNAGVLFYRTDIVENPPATWDELYEMAEKYTSEGKIKYGHAMQAAQYEGLVCNAMEFIASEGGKVVDDDGNIIINNDGVVKGLETMSKIALAQSSPDNLTTLKESECIDLFSAGDVLFMRGWPSAYANVTNPETSKVVDNVGVAALPAGSEGSFGCIGGWGVMINKNTEHVEEAWEFVKFKAGVEGQKINAITGAQPPLNQELYQDEEIVEERPFFELLVKAVDSGVPRPVSPVWTELSEIMQIEISKVVSGTEDAKKAVEIMDTEMKAITDNQ